MFDHFEALPEAAIPVTLVRGEFLVAEAIPQGMDIELRLHRSGGEPLVVTDTQTGGDGTEVLVFFCDRDFRGKVVFRAHPDTYGQDATCRVTLARTSDIPEETSRTLAEASRLGSAGGHTGQEGPEGQPGPTIAQYRELLARLETLDHPLAARLAMPLWRELGRRASQSPETRALARSSLAKSLALARTCANDALVLELLSECGEAARAVAPLEARAWFQEALDLAKVHGWMRRTAIAHNDLGTLLHSLGDIHEALYHFHHALEYHERRGPSREKAIILYNLGRAYTWLGLSRDAVPYLVQARDIHAAQGNGRSMANTHTILGTAYSQARDYDSAEQSLLAAIALRKKQGNVLQLGVLWDHLGSAYLLKGDSEAAAPHFRKAWQTFSRLGREDFAAITALNLANVHLERDRPDQALVFVRRGLDTLARRSASVPLAQAHYLHADAQFRLGRHEEARESIATAIDLVERLGRKGYSLNTELPLFASRHQYFELAAAIFLASHHEHPDRGYRERAYSFVERGLARTTVRRIAQPPEFHPATPEKRALAAELLEAEDRYGSSRAAGSDEWFGSAEEAERLRLLHRYRILTERDAKNQRTQAAETSRFGPEQARRLLRRDDLLVTYHLNARSPAVWVVGRDVFEVHPLPLSVAELEVEVARFMDLLRDGKNLSGAARLSRQAQRLGSALLKPIAEHLRSPRRLYVVRHRFLHYVPFEALEHPVLGRGPLIEKHVVAYVPSASTLAALRERHSAVRPAMRRGALILADPVYGDSDPRCRVKASPGRTSASKRADPSSETKLPRLPQSRREGQAIRDHLGEEAVVLTGFAANREALMRREGDYHLLHLAAHGRIDATQPEFSSLILSRRDERGRRTPGTLPAFQIEHLRMRADLVVLSGCQTALGAPFAGEGLLGLTRAFFTSGSRSVVVSQIQVDDFATAELMITFYGHLFGDGPAHMDAALALAQAKRDFRAKPRFASPYFWSGFVLFGDGLLREDPE
ncbi:CHAT domain-containing protein [Sulfidibacter corallicola]|uniref:CHAT domain-containing protein n=1 Tax=Sulfidibacter corallicola TaxID=2818388 RepID=A0A8A4TQK5_SULCO|nr:CHAT domain-containing protein [Sulfidibacter corallicola]QTD51464.1 CHAT domain-containing protein [Sulfidibacter corallicola]